MEKPKIRIKIFSDNQDVSTLIAAIKQLELKNIETDIKISEEFEYEKENLLLFQINNLESAALKKALEIRSNCKTKCIYIVPQNDAVLVSSLAKIGLTNLFVLPYELYKLSAYITDFVANYSYDNQNNGTGIAELNRDDLNAIIGKSSQLQRAVLLARKVSEQRNMNILILGETGTGKGVVAKAIHNAGSGNASPFVDIICTAIPEALLESELFGYEPGAFTSARNRKPGLFELAENGTLFLDEIGDLSLNIQAKLLRTIEKKVVRRLGGIFDIPIDARIISATNRDLKSMMEQNSFRKDLYHRLNTVVIELPPLRERDDDALILAEHFIKEFNEQFGKSIDRMDNDVKSFIFQYSWPGNIRELKNSIERAVLLSNGNTLKLDHFSNLIESLSYGDSPYKDVLQSLPDIVGLKVNFKKTGLKELEKMYATEVLSKINGNKSKAAKLLGISRPKLDTLL